jgi:LmbE family N-acetylglucosaminyl deacetylase
MRPRVVIAPPRDDHHPDHVAVARIVDASLHLSAVAKYCPELPSWRPHVLLHTLGSRLQSPQLVVDITEVYELRRRAILCHSSQLHREGSTEVETRIAHPLFLDWVDGALRRWGYLIGRPYGEGFTCAGPVPVLDLVGQYAKAPWEHPPRKD